MKLPVLIGLSALCFSNVLLAKVEVEIWLGRSGPPEAAFRAIKDHAPDDRFVTGGFDLGHRVVPGDPHVMRASAVIVAPASGDYRFWFCGDVHARFTLSDDSGASQPLLSVPPGSWPGQWERFAEQRSEAVRLAAGQRYQLELVSFRDWPDKRPMQLAWEGPGFKRRMIAGRDLAPSGEMSLPQATRPDLLLATSCTTAAADPLANDPMHRERVTLSGAADTKLGKLGVKDGLITLAAGPVPGRERVAISFSEGVSGDLEIVVNPPLDVASVRRDLLDGINKLPKGFTRGHTLLPMARESALLFPLKLEKADGSARGTIAIGHFGAGRVVVLPSNALRDENSIQSGDGRALWTSIVRWTRGGDDGRVMVSRESAFTRGFPSQTLVVAANGAWQQGLQSASTLVLDSGDLSTADHEAILAAVGERGMGLVLGVDSQNGEAAALVWRFGVLASRQVDGAFESKHGPSEFLGARLASLFTGGASFTDEDRDSEAAAQDIQAIHHAMRRPLSPADAQFRPTAEMLARHNEALGIVPRRGTRVTGRLIRELINLESRAIEDVPMNRITAHRTSVTPGGMEYLVPGAPRENGIRVEVDTNLTGFIPLGGLHAPAGETVTLRVPEEIVGGEWKILVGCQRFGADEGSRRMGHMQWEYPIESKTVKIVHPYGGLLYLWYPKDGRTSPAENGLVPFTVMIDHVVRAPFFVLGQTDPAEWKTTIRDFPGPRTELWGPWFAATLPSEMIRDLEDPTASLQHFNDLMKSYDEIGGYPELRHGPEYASYDIEGGAWAGYPFHGYEGWVEGQIGWDPEARCIYADAGTVHELSHSAQIRPNRTWHQNPYTRDWETTITIFDAQAKHHYPRQIRAGWAQIRFHLDQAMREIMHKSQQDGWGSTHGGYGLWPQGEGVLYVFLRHVFSDDVWHRFFHSFGEDEKSYPAALPRTDEQKRDQWLTRFSSAAGADMRRFFVDIMRLEVSAAAMAEVAAMKLPVFLPAVGGVSEAATMREFPLVIDLENEPLSYDGVCRFSDIQAGSGGSLSRRSDGKWLFTPDAGFTGVVNCSYVTTSSSGFAITNPLEVHVAEGGVKIEIHPFADPLATPEQLDAGKPLRRGFWSDASLPWNMGNNYTARLRGAIRADRSGDHEFTICHSEACAVWIWPVGHPRSSEPVFRSRREWRGPDRDRGERFTLPLDTGVEYQVEMIASFHPRHGHRPSKHLPTGMNDDYLALYWQPPGTHGPRPIGGANLAPVPVDPPIMSLPSQSHEKP